jgi:hypothetical protein
LPQPSRVAIGPIVVIVSALCLLPAGARAQDPAPAPAPEAVAPPDQKPPVAEPVELKESSESTHTGFKALMKDTVGDFKHFATDKEPLLWLVGGGGASLAVHPLDDDVNKHFAGDNVDGFYAPGKVIGYGAVQIGAAIGTWAIGRMVDKNGRAAHIGLDLLRAQIVTQAVTYGLKYSVQRDRPDGSGYSFPSGHASTTFATASVLERHFGWKAGIPTYAIATYVAASRLHEDRHWLSDVVFGGAVGMAAGRAVTRHGRSTFTMVPLLVPGGGYGIAMLKVG